MQKSSPVQKIGLASTDYVFIPKDEKIVAPSNIDISVPKRDRKMQNLLLNPEVPRRHFGPKIWTQGFSYKWQTI